MRYSNRWQTKQIERVFGSFFFSSLLFDCPFLNKHANNSYPIICYLQACDEFLFVRPKSFGMTNCQKNIRVKQTNRRRMEKNENHNEIDMKYASYRIDLKFCKSRRKEKFVDVCLQQILWCNMNRWIEKMSMHINIGCIDGSISTAKMRFDVCLTCRIKRPHVKWTEKCSNGKTNGVFTHHSVNRQFKMDERSHTSKQAQRTFVKKSLVLKTRVRAIVRCRIAMFSRHSNRSTFFIFLHKFVILEWNRTPKTENLSPQFVRCSALNSKDRR